VKFTLGWLKEHLETDAPLADIVAALPAIGLDVESVTNRAEGLDDFVVAEVLQAARHPDADKLQVCRVDTGADTVDVVCGAPNARAGMKAVFAAVGTYVPGIGLKLKKAKIRGVESNGMLLSEHEMNLGDNHDGIVELPAAAPLGAPAAEIMGLADPVIDIEITPNRGDCLGVRGIARDLAAAGLGKIRPLSAQPVPGIFDCPVKVNLDFDAKTADACPYFVGRVVRGVRNGESPKWLRDRLLAVGLRPISALVDITNFMSLAYCRPLHVFDLDKLAGNVHVRLAAKGEKLAALDDGTYDLDGEMTVIADEKSAAALGGVMGGAASGCTAETRNVFVESALFDPVRTAVTGRKLNIVSDARYRFERGVDPAFPVDGMEIATRLILDFCGGEPSALVIAGKEPDREPEVDFRPGRVESLAGVKIPKAEIERILTVLGFGIKTNGKKLRVSVPSWRSDIEGEACLVEEVVRIHGLDNIPATPMDQDGVLPHPALSPEQRRRGTARRLLAARGLVEAVTVSFTRSGDAALFGGVPDSLRLVNPISSDLDVMRPSILPNLIRAAGRNADRGIADASLFEIGPQYSGDGPGDQAMVAAGIRSGLSWPRAWSGDARPVDVFDVKADVLAVLEALGVPAGQSQITTDAPAWYHPGRSASLRLGPKTVLALFGEIHPGVLRTLGVKGPVGGFEVYLDSLPKLKARKSAAKPHLTLSPFQPVNRDFAFVVGAGVSAADVVSAVRGADKALISDVQVFDVYAGDNVGEKQKSIAVNVTLQPTEKTLTDTEIDAVTETIVAAVSKATGGVLRA